MKALSTAAAAAAADKLLLLLTMLLLLPPGMGCGNGVTAIGLIRDLLQARPNSIALFVPAEITTYAFYPGKHKQYMVANCIFRMGGAAALLSNKRQYARTAKCVLLGGGLSGVG